MYNRKPMVKKKEDMDLSVARVQMKKQKEREEKMLEQNIVFGRFGGQLGGGSRKKPAERKRTPEERVLKSTVGNFRGGVLDVTHLLHSGSSRTNDRDNKMSNYGKKNKSKDVGGEIRKKIKKKKNKGKKGGGKRKHK